jgi:rod shape-determining protein MreD
VRSVFKLLLFALLALFLEGRVSLLHVSPDLTTLLAYYAGIRYGETGGMLAGIMIGGLEDAISSPFFGPNLLGKGIVGYSSAFFTSGSLFRWTPLLGIIAVLLLTIIDNSVVFLSRTIFYEMPAALSRAAFIAVMQSLMNAPAGMFIRPRHVD